jgi:GTP cyclohydrolase I
MANDPTLGFAVCKHLTDLGIETPFNAGNQAPNLVDALSHQVHNILSLLGMDLNDDSIQDTPKRVAKMYAHEIFYGLDYTNFPKCTTIQNKMQVNEMVCVSNILVRSVCEHHLVPFVGSAAIAYIPKTKIVGLSKFNRIVDFFCRRPQVQERLTEQVAAALSFILETDDIAVVIQADHMCVKLRGVQDPHSRTTTSKLLGRFLDTGALRAEFLTLSRS